MVFVFALDGTEAFVGATDEFGLTLLTFFFHVANINVCYRIRNVYQRLFL
jgi:hypothetical protein